MFKTNSMMMLAMLPLLMMQDGDDEGQPENRNELFLNALGLSDDVQAIINDQSKDITEAVTAFKTGYSSILKQSHLSNWEEEKKTALVKETQTGSHAAFQNKLLKTFELDAETFKDVDKKTEAILQAAQKKYLDQIDQMKTKLDGKTDATSKQLQEQLDTRNAEFSTLQTQLAELKKFKEEFPALKEQIIQQEQDRAWAAQQVALAHEAIENKSASASLNLVNLLLDQKAKLQVKRGEDGKRSIQINNAQTDAPYMRTETDNYKDLGTFLKDVVLVPNKLINLQNPPSTPQDGQQTQTNGRVNKKEVRIHPNARV